MAWWCGVVLLRLIVIMFDYLLPHLSIPRGSFSVCFGFAAYTPQLCEREVSVRCTCSLESMLDFIFASWKWLGAFSSTRVWNFFECEVKLDVHLH